VISRDLPTVMVDAATGVVLPTPSQLRRRLRASGYVSAGRSGGGGWLDCHAFGNVQGYAALRVKLAAVVRELPPNLAEVATGRRVGTPTLSRASRLEVAAGLLSPGLISWRDTVRLVREMAPDVDGDEGAS